MQIKHISEQWRWRTNMSEIFIVTLTDKNDYVQKITIIFLNYDRERSILGHVHANRQGE